MLLTIQVHSQEHHTAWRARCRPDQVHIPVLLGRYHSGRWKTWHSRQCRHTWGGGRTDQTHQWERPLGTGIRWKFLKLEWQDDLFWAHSGGVGEVQTIWISLALLPVCGLGPVADATVLVKPESGGTGVLLGGSIDTGVEDVAHTWVRVRVESIETRTKVTWALWRF